MIIPSHPSAITQDSMELIKFSFTPNRNVRVAKYTESLHNFVRINNEDRRSSRSGTGEGRVVTGRVYSAHLVK